MKKRMKWTRWLAVLVALVLLAAFAAPVHAASERAEEVLRLLGQLQRADISPSWQPDIVANQQGVQALLDAYEACTEAERGELTTQQNEDLRAYFTALYAVQGKAASEVDALFAPGAGASPSGGDGSGSSGPGSGSASTGPDSSLPASESATSGSDSGSGSGSGSASASPGPGGLDPAASGGSSLPQAQNPPGSPKGDGWFSFFANQGLGTALLAALVLLVVVLFVRFVVALRKAGKAAGDDETAEARELFGENYASDENAALLETDQPPPKPGRRLKRAKEAKVTAPAKGRGLLAGKTFERAAGSGLGAGDEPGEGPANREGAVSPTPAEQRPFAGFGAAVASLPGGGGGAQNTQSPPPAPRKGTFKERAPADPLAKTVTLPDPPVDGDAPPRPRATPAQSPIGRNPDRPDPVTMRSFSAPPRTGRPAKMPFKQGDPDDLDAIDE